MSNISEHDSEQKGEENNSEKSRIGFSVSGDSVRVHDQLKRCSEIVGFEISRRGEMGGHRRNLLNFRRLRMRFTFFQKSKLLKHVIYFALK